LRFEGASLEFEGKPADTEDANANAHRRARSDEIP
jgi:hypothetical protein